MRGIISSEKEIVLEFIKKHGFATANDPRISALLGNCSSRKVYRILNYLSDVENILHKDTTQKPFVYKLKDKEFIVETLSQKEALELQYALEFISEGFNQDSIKLIRKIFQTNKDIVSGHLSSFEDFKDEHLASTYNKLLEVIENRYYAKLVFMPNFVYTDVKCVKILFLENNWYVAFEYVSVQDHKKHFRLGRLAFLKEIILLKDSKYSNKNRFQKKEIEKYHTFLDNIQNPFTLYGVKPKELKVTAKPEVAQYFKKGMKKFLKSQKFLQENEDGSVLLSITYTQPMEVIPFIQKWMPYLVVEDGEIKEKLINNRHNFTKYQGVN